MCSELEGVESEGENPAAVEGSNMEDTSGQEDHPQDEVHYTLLYDLCYILNPCVH